MYLVLKEKYDKLKYDLVLNLCVIVVQQLIFIVDGEGCVVVIEILFNLLMVVEFIKCGDIGFIKEIMVKLKEMGM